MRRYERIEWSRQDRILTLALSNPQARNAVDAAMHEELAHVFRDAADDPDSDVVVLTGAGAAFSAGGDVAWFQAAIEGRAQRPSIREAKRIVFDLLELEKPLIAKVRGPAVGLGCTIALMCDVIFADETAVFIDPHVKVGVAAGDGGAVIWPHLVGAARAKEYLMTGDPVPAAEAERIGLINRVLPAAELDGAVEAFCAKLLSGAQAAIRHTKVAINLELKQRAAALLDASLSLEMQNFETADHREAVSAFLAKRRPSFTGR